GSTIGAFGVLMDLTDLLAQPLIFAGSLRQSSLAPGIVAAGGDLQHTTHGFHWIDRLVRTYESEDFEGTASVSRANQAAAFESISRSSFSCLFSLRSRASSAFSSRVRPSWRSPRSRSSCLIQLRMHWAVGSNSFASSSALRPARASSRICWRYSAG